MPVVQSFTDELGDAQIQVGGTLYSTSWDGSPDKVYKFTDPTNPTSFTSSAAFSTINAGDQGPGSICYDSTNTALYIVMSSRGISPNKTLDIIKCVPSTLALSLVAAVNVGTLLPGKNSSLTTDGTFIYLILQFSTANAQIWKINISTGAVASTYTVVATGATGGTNIQYDSGSGKLVIAGCGTPVRSGGPGTWVGTLDTALTTESIQFVPEISVVDDDMVIIGSNAWIANEDQANTVVRDRIAKVPIASPSTYTAYTLGWSGRWAVDGLSYDGTHLWASSRIQNTDGSSSPVAQIDPTSGGVVSFYSVADWGINEIFAQPLGFTTVSTQSANNGNTFAGSNVTYTTFAEGLVSSAFTVRVSAVRGGNVIRGATGATKTIAPTIAGTSSLSATIVELHPITPSLAGVGSLSVTIPVKRALTPALAGTSTLTASLGGVGTKQFTPALAGTSTLTASIIELHPFTVPLAGGGTLTVALAVKRALTPTFAGQGNLIANLTGGTTTTHFTAIRISLIRQMSL